MTRLGMMACMEVAVALIFLSGAFGRLVAKLHLSSREVTRLVLIKDYILDLKNLSLMDCRSKTPCFFPSLRFLLLLLQSARGKLLFSAVHLAGRKIVNIRSEGDWWGRYYIFLPNLFNIHV